MKIFTPVLIVVCITISSVVIAQQVSSVVIPPSTHCPIRCDSESFPYWFCNLSADSIFLECSINPNSMSGLLPDKTHMPGNVIVVPIDTSLWWQPTGTVPDFTETPPDKETIFDDYVASCFLDGGFGGNSEPPYALPYALNEAYWDYDPIAHDSSEAQWDLDSSNFFAGLGWELIDTSDMDDTAQGFAEGYFSQDYHGLFEVYDVAESTYVADSTTHFTGNDVPYTQIWNQTNADSDANDALQSWLNQCTPPVPQTGILGGCCLHVILDTSARDFQATGADPSVAWAQTVNDTLGPGTPTCSETMCPFFARFIELNVTNAMFYQSDFQRDQHPDTTFILHSSPLMGFYTSPTARPVVFAEFSSVCFLTVVEHEIGHFLGMLHPDQPVGGGNVCSNCYTLNPAWTTDSLGRSIFHPTGFQTVMMPILAAGQPPMGLTNEDDCQFEKLYCPGDCATHGGSCLLSGVSQQNPIQQDWFNPEVYPNPSNGDMTLTFTTIAQSLTQISIYDMLGNNVKEVSNGYLNMGQQTISLGTESLPSGNYVCRVRVGDRVSYINLAITK
jgi:Secretion system C-terminal sorting domain